MQILIPIAGKGLRFKNSIFTKPKPLIDVYGKPMIIRAIENYKIKANFIFVLIKNSFYNELKNLLKKNISNCKIITLENYTEGPASSALMAEKYLDFNEELIITNCDQYILWDIDNFIKKINDPTIDGLIVTYKTNVKHNSYAKIKNNLVTEIREKEVISEYSLNGVHYWKKASYFINSAKQMITKNDRSINGEFYIGPTYNYLIKNNFKIGYYHLDENIHFSLGNVDDLNYFIKNVKI